MKSTSFSRLNLAPVSGKWYRAVHPTYATTALSTAHTRTIPSRFSAAHPSQPGFECLYLAESQDVAKFEISALLGSPYAVAVPNPNVNFIVCEVEVSLHSVLDLTRDPEPRIIKSTFQELTGDWHGYKYRDVKYHGGRPLHAYPPYVPTHKLGATLFKVKRLEGFLTFSSKAPDCKNLVLFPSKLGPPSSVEYRFFDPYVGLSTQRIPAP